MIHHEFVWNVECHPRDRYKRLPFVNSIESKKLLINSNDSVLKWLLITQSVFLEFRLSYNKTSFLVQIKFITEDSK